MLTTYCPSLVMHKNFVARISCRSNLASCSEAHNGPLLFVLGDAKFFRLLRRTLLTVKTILTLVVTARTSSIMCPQRLIPQFIYTYSRSPISATSVKTKTTSSATRSRSRSSDRHRAGEWSCSRYPTRYESSACFLAGSGTERLSLSSRAIFPFLWDDSHSPVSLGDARCITHRFPQCFREVHIQKVV